MKFQKFHWNFLLKSIQFSDESETENILNVEMITVYERMKRIKEYLLNIIFAAKK